MSALARASGLCVVFAATTAFANTDITITDKDAGKTIMVSPGDSLTVNLPGRHGEGTWRLDGDLTPELTLSGRTMESVAVPDAPETTDFSFMPRVAGTVTLKTSYAKSGADTAPSNTFTATVTVK
ncbi:MAG TPA: protease inhibitor I42 family protein [Rhizomicrobium sp.]|jgi:hypothetical protein|nr:protease inhibitor I42 family protein [Rhizomicrobium sp.]